MPAAFLVGRRSKAGFVLSGKSTSAGSWRWPPMRCAAPFPYQLAHTPTLSTRARKPPPAAPAAKMGWVSCGHLSAAWLPPHAAPVPCTASLPGVPKAEA
eukprot:scaffold26024_cov112-Isochrysis_galbana.AAC.1